MVTSFVKPQVRKLAPYLLRPYGRAFAHQFRHPVKLDQNENPFGFPPELKEEFWRRVQARDWARYPDFQMETITHRIGQYVGLSVEWVLVGNGSNELIQNLFSVILESDDVVIVPVPTFTLYKLMAGILGAEVIELPLRREDFSLDAGHVIAEAKARRAKVICLCSPNNPTGVTYPEADVRRIIEESGALVVIDEAYREFSDQDFRPLLETYPTVVLLRTFSKAMAMAGLRVGYLLARPELVREVAKARLPYSINHFSETAALVALDHLDVFRVQVQRLRDLREELFASLKALHSVRPYGRASVRPYPSQANFILFETSKSPNDVFMHCVEKGVLLRDVSHYPLLERALRVSVGTPEENEKCISALRDLFN